MSCTVIVNFDNSDLTESDSTYDNSYSHYEKIENADGTFIEFFGETDDNGAPISGKLYYSTGGTATINKDDSKVYYSNGDVYEGDLLNLKKHGKGKLIYAQGDVYEGDFVNDAMTGKGKFTYNNGDVYVGDFVDGKLNGQGEYRWAADGSVYSGGFVDGMKTGMGSYTWADKSSYVGPYVNDMKHTAEGESGTYTFANGDVYVGEFVNDARTGNGTYTWQESGDTYTGEFVNNTLNGYGTYTWASGRVYTGYFENGRVVPVEISTPDADTTTDGSAEGGEENS